MFLDITINKGHGLERNHEIRMRQLSKAFITVFVPMLLTVGAKTDVHALTAPVFSYQMNIAGNVSGPARVTTGTGGNIYIADEEAKTVTVLDQYGNKLFVIGGSDIPRSVAVDTQQRIYVGYKADEQPGYVSVFDPSGQFLRYLGSGPGEFGLPGDIAVSLGTGKVYVLDSIQNMVKVYDSGGNAVSDGQGNPFHIGGFGQYDGYNATSNPGKFDFPSGIAVDDIRQEVLVSDQSNYRVQIFDMNGAFRTAFGKHAPDTSWSFGNPKYDLRGKFSSIRGLVVDKEGRIYVADAFQGSVQVLDRTGAHLTFIGQQGDGAGQLDVPVDVTIDTHKRLIIADWNNNRLSIFNIDSGPAINNVAPTTPVQVSPAHTTQVNSITPSFTVQNSSDSNGDILMYRFQVDVSPSFSSAREFTAAEGSGYTLGIPDPALTDHTLYFWRARAEEAATSEMYASNWSGTLSFYVNALNRAPSTPAGLLPASGSAAKKSTTLSWSASTDPDLYDTVTYSVDISEKADFSSILLSQAGLGNTGVRIDTIPNYSLLTSGKTYYWRVRAIDNHGASSASSPANGFTYQKTILQTSSTPSAAKVYLDGNYGYLGAYAGTTGATPLEVVDVKPGRHVLRIERAGYFGYYDSVQVEDGETKSVTAALMASEAGTRPFTMNLSSESGVVGEGAPVLVSSKPFMVDWNNDGRKDLLVGDDGGKAYLFENTTTDASPVYRLSQNYPGGVVLTVSTKAAPFVVDWDNDGLKDLVVGCGDGTVRLYLNTASDSAPFFNNGFIDLSANGSVIQSGGNAVPVVVDWNNDNRKDLLVGDSSGKVALYVNTGTDIAPAFDNVAEVVQGANISAGNSGLGVTGDAAPLVTDWNHDGKKDLLVGCPSGYKVYFNGGTDEAPVFTTSTTEMAGLGIVPLAVDFNNDGYTDLLVGMDDGHVQYYQFIKVDEPAPAVETQAPPQPKPAEKKKAKSKSGVSKVFKKLKFW